MYMYIKYYNSFDAIVMPGKRKY